MSIKRQGHPMNAAEDDLSNGHILPVEPVTEPERIGLDESTWSDSPQALADWEAWVKTIEPLVWAPGEEEEYLNYRQQYHQFNIEAVRQQMEAMTENADAACGSQSHSSAVETKTKNWAT